MYKRIMIPLDGSDLAECVLPHAEAFFKNGLVEKAAFVTVLEPLSRSLLDSTYGFKLLAPANEPPITGQETIYSLNIEEAAKMESQRKSSAMQYLNGVATRFSTYGIKMICEVLEGHVADSLATYAEDNDIDLILVATHGRSGLGRWVMGSVADRILRASHVPVFMVHATPGCEPATEK